MARQKVYEVDLKGPNGEFRRTVIQAASPSEAKKIVQRLEDANYEQRQHEIAAYTALAEENPEVVIPADYPKFTVTGVDDGV